MKTIRLLIFGILLTCLPPEVYAIDHSPNRVYLTFQSDNGSFRQETELDGTICIYVMILDVINVNVILLNGLDVTTEMVQNHYALPTLSKNATLNITFENAPSPFNQKKYNTVSYQSFTTESVNR